MRTYTGSPGTNDANGVIGFIVGSLIDFGWESVSGGEGNPFVLRRFVNSVPFFIIVFGNQGAGTIGIGTCMDANTSNQQQRRADGPSYQLPDRDAINMTMSVDDAGFVAYIESTLGGPAVTHRGMFYALRTDRTHVPDAISAIGLLAQDISPADNNLPVSVAPQVLDDPLTPDNGWMVGGYNCPQGSPLGTFQNIWLYDIAATKEDSLPTDNTERVSLVRSLGSTMTLTNIGNAHTGTGTRRTVFGVDPSPMCAGAVDLDVPVDIPGGGLPCVWHSGVDTFRPDDPQPIGGIVPDTSSLFTYEQATAYASVPTDNQANAPNPTQGVLAAGQGSVGAWMGARAAFRYGPDGAFRGIAPMSDHGIPMLVFFAKPGFYPTGTAGPTVGVTIIGSLSDFNPEVYLLIGEAIIQDITPEATTTNPAVYLVGMPLHQSFV